MVRRMTFTIIIVIALYAVLQTIFTLYSFRKSSELIKNTFILKTDIGDSSKPTFKLFVGGDSVGAGVGASSFETSVAGRLAVYFAKDHFVQFESQAKNGSKMADMLTARRPAQKQDLIVLVVSSNDLFRFSDVKLFEDDTKKVIEEYSKLANKLIIVGPGRIFDTYAVPLVFHPIYKSRASLYSDVLDRAAKGKNNVYHIDPTLADKTLKNSYGNTLASDNFHPNDEGHRFWFDLISKKL